MIIKNEPDLIMPYLKDASNFEGKADKVFIPESFQELRELVKDCYDKSKKITISSARTSLTGSSIPLNGVIISMEKFDKIIKIDKENKIAILQPGVIIADLEDELTYMNLFYPPHPTENHSSIGGNIATNASGAMTFKYGATRKFVRRLKLLLANGKELEIKRGKIRAKDSKLLIETLDNEYKIPVFDLGMPCVKNASGYFLKKDMDLIDLFIGSEGTLAIVTEIEIDLIDMPENVIGGLVFFENLNNLFRFVNQVRDFSIENNKIHYSRMQNVSARLIEYFDSNSLGLLRKKYPQIPDNVAGAIWFEQEYKKDYEDIILDKWYNIIKKYTVYSDMTWIAINNKEHQRLKDFRHELPLEVFELLTKNNLSKFGTDTAVLDKYVVEYYQYILKRVNQDKIQTFIWGHIGNSHFHVNLLPKDEIEIHKALKIYDDLVVKALEFGGTISAEHGIGKSKKAYFKLMYGEEIIEKMKGIKSILDDKNILGIGNLF